MRRTAGTLAILALVAVACADDDDAAPGTDDGPDAVEATPRPDPDRTEPATPEATPGEEGDDAEPAPEAAGGIDVRTDHPVAAQPGRWAIGDAGFVEFDLADTGLMLVDVAAADGWSASVDEDSTDEIEVDFERGDVDIEVEIEWDGGMLEVDINTDVDPAEPGEYELGLAGSMEFAVDGERLALRDLTVSEGWELRTDEESADEIEFRVTSGDERWRVEIELDDGEVELEIDYRVRSTT